MNLLELPQEVLVKILSHMDASNVAVCSQVSRYCKTLLDFPILRYKLALARSGMVDGHATRVPVKDRLDGLESYEQVWRNSNPIQDPKHIIANQEPYRCCRFSGCAVPIICGRKFKLHLPASPTRRIRSKMWSLDLDDIQLDPEYCATDLSQDLLVLCGAKTATTCVYECHIISLSDAVISHETAAAMPILTTTTSAHWPTVRDQHMRVVICGDLLAWTWADDAIHLYVYNWKSAQVVWACNHRDPIHFAFLDQLCLAVHIVQNDAVYLRVYAVDPETPAHTPPIRNVLPDAPDMRIFLLPPTEEDCYGGVERMDSKRPSGRRAPEETLFKPDPESTVLVIVLRTVNFSLSNTVKRPGVQDWILVVPTRALLAHVRHPRRSSTGPSHPHIGSDHSSDPHRDAVPWQAWGETCSRLLPLTDRFGWVDDGPHVMGSKCLIISGRPGPDVALDAFVFDFHPFAADNRSDEDDSKTVQLYMDTSDVLTDVDILKDPVRNSLLFRVMHKVVKYDPAISYQWGQLSAVLLEDGIAVINNSVLDRSRGIMHLLAV